jgi:hypothetical protein
MRRTHLRGHTNILKRVLMHAAAFNLGLVCAASTTFAGVLPQLRMLPVCDLFVRTYVAF